MPFLRLNFNLGCHFEIEKLKFIFGFQIRLQSALTSGWLINGNMPTNVYKHVYQCLVVRQTSTSNAYH